jgi:hypothetical protein
MNANELAKKIENYSYWSIIDFHYIKEAATMLRQQQAEIEALNRTKVSCIHCGKVMDVSNHGKYHGIKCKSVVSVQQ